MSKLFPVVCWVDPAIDTTKCDVYAYRDWRHFEKLQFLPEKKPTVFYLREATTVAVNRFVESAPESEQFMRAFRLSVVRIEGLVLSDGTVLDQWEPKKWETVKGDANGVNIFDLYSDAEINTITSAEVQEIGLVARTRFFSSRKITPVFPPPDMSWQILASRMCHLAALDKSTAEDGKSESPPAGGAATAT